MKNSDPAGSKGFVLWFTGLSGAGKSTLAAQLAKAFEQRGLRYEILDGDVVRKEMNQELSYSREDREKNLLRIAYIARLLARHGVAVIVSTISPYRDLRDRIRAQTPDFVETFIDASFETCKTRDVKGLYKKALSGEIKSFTGLDDPYEPPLKPEIRVQTEKKSLDESTNEILEGLKGLGYLD